DLPALAELRGGASLRRPVRRRGPVPAGGADAVLRRRRRVPRPLPLPPEQLRVARARTAERPVLAERAGGRVGAAARLPVVHVPPLARGAHVRKARRGRARGRALRARSRARDADLRPRDAAPDGLAARSRPAADASRAEPAPVAARDAGAPLRRRDRDRRGPLAARSAERPCPDAVVVGLERRVLVRAGDEARAARPRVGTP